MPLTTSITLQKKKFFYIADLKLQRKTINGKKLLIVCVTELLNNCNNLALSEKQWHSDMKSLINIHLAQVQSDSTSCLPSPIKSTIKRQ